MRAVVVAGALATLAACHDGQTPPAKGAAADPSAEASPRAATLDVLAADFDPDSLAPDDAAPDDAPPMHHHHEGMSMPAPSSSAPSVPAGEAQ